MQAAADHNGEVIESFYVGSISSSRQLEGFDRVPSQAGSRFVSTIGTCLTFAFVLLIPMFLLQEAFGRQSQLAIVVTTFVFVFPAIWIASRVFQVLSRWLMRVQKTKDDEKLAPPKPSEIYVGIAYAEGIWSYRDDTMWDRGYLDLSGGQIRFRGFASEFGLALSQIQGVGLIQSKRSFLPPASLVYVCWLDDRGIENYFSLEIREEIFAKEIFKSTVALRDAIREAVEADEGRSAAKFYEMPFKSSTLEFSGQKIILMDVKVAALWTTLLFAIFLTLGELARRAWDSDFPWQVMAGVFSAQVYQEIVYHRVTGRKRGSTS